MLVELKYRVDPGSYDAITKVIFEVPDGTDVEALMAEVRQKDKEQDKTDGAAYENQKSIRDRCQHLAVNFCKILDGMGYKRVKTTEYLVPLH